MYDALDLVRRDLGSEATVLHTRRVPSNFFTWLTGSHHVEIVAADDVQVASRVPDSSRFDNATLVGEGFDELIPSADTQDFRTRYRDDVKQQLADLQSLVEQLCQREQSQSERELPQALFQLFTNLIDAEVNEKLAREFVDQIRQELSENEELDIESLNARATQKVEQEIGVTGPIQVEAGKSRLVALVGPTGVGKTTTIAKLAANYRLCEKVRVGLITVDTYRIAAVDQLRTYADIIDLPMEVVSTPREMREAVSKLDDLDLVLMDTAGRSPRDEVKIQALKSMLAEARPDEVHLVLSSAASAASLIKTAERFSGVGTTTLILTKLDEATGLGNLLPLIRNCRLPLSYITNGQNVPDDIQPADPHQLALMMLGGQE